MRTTAWILGIVAIASAASADPVSDRAAGEAAFRVGAQAFRANRFAVAAQAFEQAYERDARPETAFSIAQANRLQYYLDRVAWRLQRAVQLYQVYLEKLPAGPRSHDALDRLGEIEPILKELRQRGELTPFVPPVRTQLVIGAEVERATLTVDGQAAALWEPIDVSTGSHEIAIDAPGYQPARRRVVIAAGRFLPVDVALEAKPATIAIHAEAGARLLVDGREIGTAGTMRAEVAAGEHVVTVTRRGRIPWTQTIAVGRDQHLGLDAPLVATGQRRVARWILGGAGLVAVAAGGLELAAIDARRDARALDAKRRAFEATPDDLATYNRRVGEAERRDRLAYGLGFAAVGIAALGAGMYWFDHEDPPAPLRVQAAVSRDGGMMLLGGTF